MLTPTQKRRFKLYQKLRSLAKVAESESVSREAVRQCLEKMRNDCAEYQEYKTIAQEEKGGRPRQYANPQQRQREYMKEWRASKKLQSSS